MLALSWPVVVTGAGGFLGGAVVRALAAAAPDASLVRALVSAPSQPFVAPPAGVAVAQADIDDVDALAALFEGAACVVHLAGPSSVAASFEHPALFARAHAAGTAAVVEAATARDVPALVHVSSAEVYGQPQADPVTEDHPLAPRSPYGAAKACAEAMLVTAKRYRGRVAMVRPFSVYGPGQPGASLLSGVLRQALDPATDEVVVADLRPVRDYCFVEDVAEAALRAAGAPRVAGDGAPRVYNAASGVGVAVAELAALAADVAAERTGRRKPVREDPSRRRPGGADILHLVADVSRAARELGWAPRTPLREGLRRTVASLVEPPAPGAQPHAP